MIRVIIAGGRDFNDRKLLRQSCDKLLHTAILNHINGIEDLEIIEGQAAGADYCGKMWAKDRQLLLTEFPAEWDKYGKAAGFIRNKKMGLYAREAEKCGLIAFWDGKSKGTAMMIEIASELGLEVRVIKY